jgi:hypothetical protein
VIERCADTGRQYRAVYHLLQPTAPSALENSGALVLLVVLSRKLVLQTNPALRLSFSVSARRASSAG